MGFTITAIVPAYNEEKRIAQVLAALSKSKHISEVICVNDASTDRTVEIVRTFQSVRLIDLRVNGGKANAIAEGILAAKSDLVMFIDADLQGLNDEVIRSLVDPISSGGYQAVVALPSKFEDVTWFRPLTGERCYFKGDLMPYLHELRNKGYGLELALNYLFRDKKVKIVRMHGVAQLHKVGKYSLQTALKRELNTWQQMFREVASHEKPARFAYHAYLRHYYIKPRRRTRAAIESETASLPVSVD